MREQKQITREIQAVQEMDK